MASVETVPDKLYFRIGEASRIVGVKPYVLRYWETEFAAIKPEKSSSRQRLYRRQDVQLFCQIRHLLHDERFTIEGCRKQITSAVVEKETPEKLNVDWINRLRGELESVREMIQNRKS